MENIGHGAGFNRRDALKLGFLVGMAALFSGCNELNLNSENLPEWMPEVADKYWDYYKKYETEKIPAQLGAAQSLLESAFYSKAGSYAGARGIMQIMPNTGIEIAAALGVKNYNLLDPETNIRFGMKYLDMLANMFSSTRDVVEAYYLGPGGLMNGWSNKTSRDYAASIYGMYQEASAKVSQNYDSWLQSVFQIKGGLLYFAFEEQGLDWQKFVTEQYKRLQAEKNQTKSPGIIIANTQTQSQIPNFNCITYTKDNLPNLVYPGDVVITPDGRQFVIRPGGTAGKTWKKAGQPETIQICR
jgi:hypothetical protein